MKGYRTKRMVSWLLAAVLALSSGIMPYLDAPSMTVYAAETEKAATAGDIAPVSGDKATASDLAKKDASDGKKAAAEKQKSGETAAAAAKKEKTFQVVFDAGEGYFAGDKTNHKEKIAVTEGKTLTALPEDPEPAEEGYVFAGWYPEPEEDKKATDSDLEKPVKKGEKALTNDLPDSGRTASLLSLLAAAGTDGEKGAEEAGTGAKEAGELFSRAEEPEPEEIPTLSEGELLAWIVKKDVTFLAKWEEEAKPEIYTVRLDAGAGFFDEGRTKKTMDLEVAEGEAFPALPESLVAPEAEIVDYTDAAFSGEEGEEAAENPGKPGRTYRKEYRFAGWFLDPEGEVPASFGEKDAITEDVTLYAGWKTKLTLENVLESGWTVTFDFNNDTVTKYEYQFFPYGSLDEETMDPSGTFSQGGWSNVSNNYHCIIRPKVYDTGRSTFLGWLDEDGNMAAGADGEFDFHVEHDTVFTALYTWTVDFDFNNPTVTKYKGLMVGYGSTLIEYDLPASGIYSQGGWRSYSNNYHAIIIPSVYASDRYEFLGWEDEDGNMVSGSDGEFNFHVERDTKLTAKWNVLKHEVILHAGGGYFNDDMTWKTMALMVTPGDTPNIVIRHTSPTVIFAGWGRTSEGSGIDIPDLAYYPINEDLELWARFRPPVAVRFYAPSGAVVRAGGSDYICYTTQIPMDGKLEDYIKLSPYIIPDNPDQAVLGWYTNSSYTGTRYNDPICQTYKKTLNADLDLYAKVGSGYKITYNANGGSFSGSSTYVEYVEGGQYYGVGDRIPVPTKDEHSAFFGWFTNAACSIPAEVSILNENRTYYAGWKNVWNVKLDYNGGTLDYENGKMVQVVKGKTLSHGALDFSITDQPERGSEEAFTGWYQDKACTKKIDPETYVISKDQTLYAGYGNYWRVTVEGNGLLYGPDSSVEVHVPRGETVSLPEPDDDYSIGVLFGGYELDGKIVDHTSYKPTKHVSLMAKTVQMKNVQFSLDGGQCFGHTYYEAYYTPWGYESRADRYAATPTWAKGLPGVDDMTKTGFIFEGWYEDAAKTKKITDTANWRPTKDVTVYANWAAPALLSYHVATELHTFEVPTGSPVGGNHPGVIKHPTEGAAEVFDKWYLNPGLTQPVDDITSYVVTGNTNFFAGWKSSLLVSYDENGGSINLSLKPVPAMKGQTLTAAGAWIELDSWNTVPPAGKLIDGWYVGSQKVDGDYVIMNDVTLTAKWVTARNVTMNFGSGDLDLMGKKTVTIADGHFLREVLVDESRITPPAGKEFNGWYSDSACTAPVDPDTFKVTKNMTVYAGYKTKSAQVKITVNTNGGYATGFGPSVIETPKGSAWRDLSNAQLGIGYWDEVWDTLARDIILGRVTPVGLMEYLKAPSEGKVYEGLYTAASGGTRITDDTAFDKNTTLYAHYGTGYKVTLDINGGQFSSTGAQTQYFYGNANAGVFLPEEGLMIDGHPQGKLFDGWYTNAACTTKAPATLIGGRYRVYYPTKNITLFAKWKDYEAATALSLSKTSLTLLEGNSEKITVTVSPAALAKSVRWIADDGGKLVSLAAAADGSLTVTAKKGIDGVTNITASVGGKTAKVKVTVKRLIPVTGVKLSKTALTLANGKSATLTATVSPADATNKAVTWTTSNATVATVSGGKITAKAAGTATITVKTKDGNKTATCKVTVTQPVTGVTLSKASLSLAVGKTEKLTATVKPSNATNKNVTWTSSSTAIATVAADGTVKGVKAGTATITVKTKDGGKTATCKVTVGVPVTGVKLSKTALSLAVGKTQKLGVTISPSNASNKSVTWSSSNKAVATVAADGTVKAVKAGSATITVTTKDGGKTATCKVTVPQPVTGVKISKTSTSLDMGKTFRVTATVSPTNAANKNVTWKSSNTSVATVAADGTITAVGAGTATITVTTRDGAKTAACKVTVKAPVRNGWADIGGSRYYYKDGQPVKGFQRIGGKYYYFDPSTGAMKKGEFTVDRIPCYFDPVSGEGLHNGWLKIGGKDYWYEKGQRQGTKYDPNGVKYDGTVRGREIYDAASDGWYWLDAVYDGAKAVSKEVMMPYIYSNEVPGSTDGKWVRYDGGGAMIKGWYIDNAQDKTVYYDPITGAMAKGEVTIKGKTYKFNKITGALIGTK